VRELAPRREVSPALGSQLASSFSASQVLISDW
jgi:hypothetical protein